MMVIATEQPWGTRDVGPFVARLLEPGALVAVFQPIVRLTDGAIVGYEALTRAADGSARSPEDWFAVARAEESAARLDAACLRAIAEAGAPPAGQRVVCQRDPDVVGVAGGGGRPRPAAGAAGDRAD